MALRNWAFIRLNRAVLRGWGEQWPSFISETGMRGDVGAEPARRGVSAGLRDGSVAQAPKRGEMVRKRGQNGD